MSRESSLVKNTLIISIGKIFTQLITFFLMPLYTGILSTTEYGVVDLLNTLVALLIPIITLQIEQAIFRNLISSRNKMNEEQKIITNGLLSVSIQCLFFLVFIFIVFSYIDNEYKYFLIMNVIAYVFSSIFLQIARGLGQNKIYSIASFFSAFSTVLFNIILLVVIKLGVYGMLIGTLMGQLICSFYLFYFLNIKNYIKISFIKLEVIFDMIKYSFPLVPNIISWWVFNASDRLIVSTFLGLSQNGLLSLANKFSSLYVSMYSMFNISWTESIILHINDIDIKNYFNSTLDTILKIFVSIAFMLISLLPFIFPILANIKFTTAYYLIPLLVIASLCNVLVGLISTIYIANKNTKAIAKTSSLSAIINVIVHISLIKSIGLYAAAISTLISYFVLMIYRYKDIKENYLSIIINQRFIIKSLIILIIICFCYYSEKTFLNILSVIISLIYTIISNKNLLIKLTKFINKKYYVINIRRK